MTGEDLEDLPLPYDILCEMVSLLDIVESSKTDTVENYNMSHQHLYCETRWTAQPNTKIVPCFHQPCGEGMFICMWNVNMYIFTHI